MQIPYIPGDPNFLNKKKTTVYNPFVVINTPKIIHRNRTIKKYTNPIQIDKLQQSYNVISPPGIKHINSYTVYNTNELITSQNIGAKTLQSQNLINNPVNNLNLNNGINNIIPMNLNKITSIKVPTLNAINNINTVSKVVVTAENPTLINGVNNIIQNPNIIASVEDPSLINGVNNITNPNIITTVKGPTTTINGVAPTQNIITTTFKVPTMVNNVKKIIPTQNIFTAVKSPNLVSNVGSIVTNQNVVNNLYNMNNVNNLNGPNINNLNLIGKNPNFNLVPKVQINLAGLNNQILNFNNNFSNIEPGERINLSEFKIVNEIGKGTFGKIYKVIWLKNNKYYALKKEVLNDIDGVKVRQHRNETIRNFIQKTKSNGVVNIYGNFCIPKGNEFYNFELMELCERDFEQEIKGRAELNSFYSEIELYNVMFQLISTLSCLQKNHITHRDIKPQNILISNGIYKLCDFGDVRLMEREGIVVQRVRGSELYMSPILFNGLRAKLIHVRHNTYKSDVFSLGMCFLLAACLNYDGLVEIRELSDMRQKEMILKKYLSARYSPKCISILLLMLQTEEINRPDFIVLESAIKEYGL